MASTVLFIALLSFLGLLAAQQTAIITELPAYSSLTECARSGVSSAARDFSNFWCSPTTVATALAACMCLNWQYSEQASNEIIGYVTETCGASASDKLSSALNVLTTYCLPASNAAAAVTTPTPLVSSPGSLRSVSTTPILTGAPTASNSPENSASSFGTSNDNRSSPNLSSSISSTATFTTPTTTSISPTSTSTSSSTSTNLQNLNPSPSPPLSGGAIAGIVLGSVIVVLTVLVLGRVSYRHRHKKSVSGRSPSLRSDHGSIELQSTVLE